MQSTRAKEKSEKADRERKLCRDWLLTFMQDGQPRVATKDELRTVAMRNFGVSKSSFDYGWIAAIEHSGRQDWYEPLPRRKQSKN